jgi:hypothetical protein
MPVPPRVTDLPDPYLYSQFYLQNLGLPFTWDNPDVRLFRNGVEAYTYNLLPDTEYRLVVTLHNNSTQKAAPQTDVEIVWIEFGIGGGVAARHPISHPQVDIAARGQPGEPATVQTTWRTPAQPGHYCIEVTLAHPVDGNNGNNRGWNNTLVKDGLPGETLAVEIPVWNAFPKSGYKGDEFLEAISKVELALDSYELRFPQEEDEEGLRTLFAPVPAAWDAALDRAELRLPPGGGPEQVTLQFTVPADAGAGTRQVFNVSGTVKGRPTGGVTVIAAVQEG